ncbi:MAG TPA: DUF3810 domain-containing protein [Pyrinomonadaceae bacterium]|nr:DUF3810 domain-containing protein [Pyrinomonadaceae bacterium]
MAAAPLRVRRWFGTVGNIIREVGRVAGVPLGVLLGGVLLQMSAALLPGLTERLYVRAVYPHIPAALSLVSGRVGFSLGEVLTFAALTAGLVFLVRFFLLLYRQRGERARSALGALRFSAWLAAGLLWLFMLTFGLNYQRPLLFDLLGFERRSASAAELEAMGREVVGRINESYAEAHTGGRAAPDPEQIKALLEESYDAAPDLTLLPRGPFAPPKPLYASGAFTRIGLSGVYSPFTGEPNYNADMPDFQLPFTMAHEMAHQRGVARESEANFVAYLVCINSRDPFVRYSGYRNGLGVLGELYRVEPEQARELAKQLSPGFREDSRRAALFWAKAYGPAAALTNRVNDLYLRANRVRKGTADYAASTTLIVGYYLRELKRAERPAPN